MKAGRILLILICVFFSCKSNRINTRSTDLGGTNLSKPPKEKYISDFNLLTIENSKYKGKDSLISISGSDNQVTLKGKFAINNENTLTGLKYGLVEEFYLNGNLKSKGKYEIGKYIQCCAGGLCAQYYNYKFGEWNYYYENGKKEANVLYQVKNYNLRTSCEGGANIQFGKIKSEVFKCWTKDGEEKRPDNERIQELETVVFSQSELFSKIAKYQNEALSLIGGNIKLDIVYIKK